MKALNENTGGLDDLDLALAGIDTETIAGDNEETLVEDVLETVSDEVVEEIVEEGSAEVTAADGALADDLLRDLDISLEVQESYNAQEGAAIDPDGAKQKAAEAKKGAGKKAAAPKAKKAKATKPDGEKAARTPRNINTVAPEFFALTEPAAGADLDAIKTATLALKPGQVKIAEKFDNLFTSLSVGKAPSTYVMIAFDLLDEKKSMTSSDLVAAYKASGLGEGTARSQCGQIMALFATVGIADRASQVLTLRADSKIAERIRSLPAA